MRYDETQVRAVSYMPYHLDKRLMGMLWLMVSKAADRSSRVSTVTLSVLMYIGTFKRAGSVELN